MVCDRNTLAVFNNAISRLQAADFELIECEINGWLEAERAAGVISLFENGRALTSMNLALASDGIRKRAALAKLIKSDDIAAARSAAGRFKNSLRETIDAWQADAVITPTWPFAAPFMEADTVSINGRDVPIDPYRNCFVRAANAVDACALTLPAGLYPDESVPAGLHLMTVGGRELGLLAAARVMEGALPPLPACQP
jgi:Asp-tRNA(Asn)/Glu-tRNA(Gln) amidotransferase A subunit family amidase